MSVYPSFEKPQPVLLSAAPIVLRFQGLHPGNLGKFRMHDRRAGGDLAHVDRATSNRNRIEFGAPEWASDLRFEIAQAQRSNLTEELTALRAKHRMKEASVREQRGLCDPWRHSKEGPLREGILTVNKAWLGGTGIGAWDGERVGAFLATALDFLKLHFPGAQLRFVSSHSDEEAFHLHFVVAVWSVRETANRGRQVTLQPSANALIANYERAQDLAGEHFAQIGLQRGERRAEARRAAKAAGEEPSAPRRHVPPSEWRRGEIRRGKERAAALEERAEAAAQNIIETAKSAASTALRKSRKRAIKEARGRKESAERAAMRAETQRRVEEEAARKWVRKGAEAALACSGEQRRLKEVEGQATLMHHLLRLDEKRREKVVAEVGRAAEAKAAVASEIESGRGEIRALETQKTALRETLKEWLKLGKAVQSEAAAVQLGVEMLSAGELRWQPEKDKRPAGLVYGPPGTPANPLDDSILEKLGPGVSILELIARQIHDQIVNFRRDIRSQQAQDAAFLSAERKRLGLVPDARLGAIAQRTEPGLW